MITTTHLKKLAPIVCPETGHRGKAIWKGLWIAFAEEHANANPPVIANKAALDAAFKIGAAQ